MPPQKPKISFFERTKDVAQLIAAVAVAITIIVGFFGYIINTNTSKNFAEIGAKLSDLEHSQNYMKLNIEQTGKSVERERQERESEQMHMQDSINVRLTRIEDKIDRYAGKH